MISIVPRRRSTRRGLVAVVAAALLAPLVVAQPAGAGPGTAGHVAAAATTAMTDLSTEMPRTRHNEVAGDFLSKGYDQRAIVESGNLNIYDSAARGGALLKSTPTDLYEVTAGDNDGFFMWAGATASDNSYGAIPLAWAPGSGFFMAGYRKDLGVNYLYKLPADGSCATQGCADWVTQLPGYYPGGGWPEQQSITTTALAVGMIGTKPVVAAGLNIQAPANSEIGQGGVAMAGGIYVLDEAQGGILGTYSEIPNAEFTALMPISVITALDWDDNGSGLLAIGAHTPWRNLHAVRVSANGTFSNHTFWDVMESPILSVAVGHRPDGSPVVAYGTTDGKVNLWDPSVPSQSLLAKFTAGSDPVNALTFTDRIDGSIGAPDLVAVSSRNNTSRVLRYSESTTLTALPVAPNGGKVTDVGGIRAWFPGYKTGAVEFLAADVATDFELDFATRPNPAYGCWFAQDFADRPALPTEPVTLQPDSALSFALAGFTAGVGGDCAATDSTGQWAAYVTITPVGRPADRTVAKLVVSRSGQLTVKSAGGSVKLTVGKYPTSSYPLGTWQVMVQAAPSFWVPKPATLTGTQLDAAGTDRPVYRFDLSATTWPLPVSSPPRVQTVLPPLIVRGCMDSGDCVDLGMLVPQGKPTRATSGTVTLPPVSFYWQNPSAGPQLDYLLVLARQGDDIETVTDAISLSDIPAPAAGPTVGQVVVCPASGTTSCDGTADPMANGLDQAPLRILLNDANGQTLPLGSGSPYGRVYYRDLDGDVVTGLIPMDGSAYVRVSPYAGAYANDNAIVTGSNGRAPVTASVGGRLGYLSTTSIVEQQLTAHVGGSDLASDPITVKAVNFTPQVQPGAKAGPGFYITGCSDNSGNSYCNLVPVSTTVPGLFLTNDPTTGDLRIGLQFATSAQTSATSLPLQQVAGQPEHNVAAQTLNVSYGEVSLGTTSSFQPADAIDTWLVTHGTQVPVRAVQVGGGN